MEVWKPLPGTNDHSLMEPMRALCGKIHYMLSCMAFLGVYGNIGGCICACTGTFPTLLEQFSSDNHPYPLYILIYVGLSWGWAFLNLSLEEKTG